MLEGPDYSEVIVSKLTPSVWETAKQTPANYSSIHGYRTIADIMRDLNPIQGRIWQLTVKHQRIAREAGVLIYGRHSHPSTLIHNPPSFTSPGILHPSLPTYRVGEIRLGHLAGSL
jgi:hydrogenase large subunit